MRRREFLQNTIFVPALGLTLVYSISNCSSDDSTATTNTSEETTGTEPAGTCTTTDIIIDLHFHTIEDPDLTNTVDITLAMGGPHTHSVTLTAAELENLSKCGTVINTSTLGSGHSHQVTFIGIV